MNQAKKLKDTLNLLQTEFPMWANAVENEPQRMKHWDDSKLYQKMLDSRSARPLYCMTDPHLPTVMFMLALL